MADDKELRVMTVDDIVREHEEDVRQWLETRRISVAQYVPDDNTIRLHVYQGSTYDIDLDRMKTAEQFTDWILHLTGKTWGRQAIPDLLECMRYAIEEEQGLELRQYFGVGGGLTGRERGR